MQRIKLLFITDPWNTLDHSKDTTLRIMEEALALRLEVFWSTPEDIEIHAGKLQLSSRRLLEIATPNRGASDFTFSAEKNYPLSHFHQIHYRVDPPVDAHYENPLKIIALFETSPSRWVNPIEALLLQSEKLEGLLLQKISPKTLISSKKTSLEAFLKKYKKLILKPLNQAQSKGVQVVTEKDMSVLKTATSDFLEPILLQEFLPEIESQGETRIWFVDGKILGCLRKLPKQGTAVMNPDLGMRLKQHSLTSPELKSAKLIGAQLKKRRIRIAAVDLISNKISDYNFTSPGLLVELENLIGKNLTNPLLKSLTSRL